MSSKAIRETIESPRQGESWKISREVAPSTIVAVGPVLPRVVASLAVVALVLGGFTLLLYARLPNTTRLISPTVASLFVIAAIFGIIYHALADADLQVRRLYAILGFALFVAAIFLSWWPTDDVYGAKFMPWGVLGFVLGLMLLLAFLRNETDQQLRELATHSIGILGGAMAFVGFFFSSFDWAAKAFGAIIRSSVVTAEPFLLGHGVLLMLLGLIFGVTFIVLRPKDDIIALRAGLGMGIGGAVFLLLALYRSLLIHILVSWKWIGPQPSYVMPSGLLLMGMGLLYVFMALLLCSEWTLLVMIRRELTRFFCTPIAYIVLLACVTLSWGMFALFATIVTGDRATSLAEPMVGKYLFGQLAILPVVTLLVIIPLLTMGLISDEKRNGTIEMLLTVRVSEALIVVSKYVAALVVFILFWLPWSAYLISLRIYGEQPFDYRPLISFYIAMLCLGVNFVAVGVFCSSLTQNQLTAGILSFLWMMFMIVAYFLQFLITDPFWTKIFEHTSFITVWAEAVEGKLALRRVIYHVSAGVFFLIATVKVLEIRRWK